MEMSNEAAILPGEDVAYEPNWYRVLKALSLGQELPLGANPDAAFPVLTPSSAG
jgi:hypothetical protein